ncbi:MAG TPA: hypothetical protein VNN77_00785 [candidate division Zixibacteria bacterium]|nr:hypothetical protein [candidate division Zixibacteria bacterium]
MTATTLARKIIHVKECPACSARYGDEVNFCANDGRSLVTKTSERSRLCPQCANSIPEQASKCPYCKSDLRGAPAPQWPEKEEFSTEPGPAASRPGLPLGSKIILMAGFALFALGVFLVGGQTERSESQSVIEEKARELEARERKIQEQDRRIRALESEVDKSRAELTAASKELVTLKARLEDSQRALSAAQEKLRVANREVERLAGRRAGRGSPRGPDSSPAVVLRRPAEPGVYETIRHTQVHEEPSGSSRTVSEIKKGTKVTVVRSVGEWLEVRSRLGNPPGYIRWDDAMFVGKSN